MTPTFGSVRLTKRLPRGACLCLGAFLLVLGAVLLSVIATLEPGYSAGKHRHHWWEITRRLSAVLLGLGVILLVIVAVAATTARPSTPRRLPIVRACALVISSPFQRRGNVTGRQTSPDMSSDANYDGLHLTIPPPGFSGPESPPPSYEVSQVSEKPVQTPPPSYSAAVDLSGQPVRDNAYFPSQQQTPHSQSSPHVGVTHSHSSLYVSETHAHSSLYVGDTHSYSTSNWSHTDTSHNSSSHEFGGGDDGGGDDGGGDGGGD